MEKTKIRERRGEVDRAKLKEKKCLKKKNVTKE